MIDRRQAGRGVEPREGWAAHWQALRLVVDMRMAAIVALLLLGFCIAAIQIYAAPLERFYYDVNLAVNHRDLRALNTDADVLTQDYLAGLRHPGVKECVLLGASYTATSVDPDPRDRLQGQLEQRLDEVTGEKWNCTNLASDGSVSWAHFFYARLLRLKRPPDVLIVALDTLTGQTRNQHLVLNLGVHDRELTPGELAYAVEYNKQPLYISEANLFRWLRDQVGFFRAFFLLAHSYPQRANVVPWTRFALSRLLGRPAPVLPLPGGLRADGTPKSWHELPGQKARIEFFKRVGGWEAPWNEQYGKEIDLLFAELARCQAQGIRVIVVSMPRNMAMPHKLGQMQPYITESAQRHGLKFHDYWLSGLIPEQYYIDYGHYFGQGCAIMATELACLIASPPGSGGVTPPATANGRPQP